MESARIDRAVAPMSRDFEMARPRRSGASGPPAVPARADAPAPFFGWSEAARRFRQLAAALAPGVRATPLIVGPPGAGKRTMAAAWRALAGAGAAELPVADLDRDGPIPERCIGVTTRPLARGQVCLHLDTGFRRPVPEGEVTGEPLRPEVADRFATVLYLPPLHGRREIDILALLYHANTVRLPGLGVRYRSISGDLLFRMMLDWEWPANARGLMTYLEAAATLDRAAAGAAEGEIRLEEKRELGRFGGGPSRATGPAASRGDWCCEIEEVPFDRLPDLAVAVFAWHCKDLMTAPSEAPPRWGEAMSRRPLELLGGRTPPGHFDGPGADEEFTPSPLVLLPQAHWGEGQSLGASRFQDLSAEAFVREVLCLGLAPGTPGAAERLAEIAKRLQPPAGDDEGFPQPRSPFLTHGATFASLKEGLAVRPRAIAEGPKHEQPHGAKTERPRRKRPRSAAMTDKQMQAYTLVKLQGQTLVAAGAVMSCSAENVRKLVERAEPKLKAMRVRSARADKSLPVDHRGQVNLGRDKPKDDDTD